jgi:glycine cleavage system transcriptional repressor
VMLVVTAPRGLDEASLRRALEGVRERTPLESVSLTEVPALDAGVEATHAISVYGADHPGIVHAVAAVLSDEGVNVVGLSTRLAGELYVMLLDVALPPSIDEPRLAELLAAVGRAQGVDVSVRAAAGDEL